MAEDLREPLEQKKVSLTPSQWAWLDRQALVHQTRSQSAELRRLIEADRIADSNAVAVA